MVLRLYWPCLDGSCLGCLMGLQQRVAGTGIIWPLLIHMHGPSLGRLKNSWGQAQLGFLRQLSLWLHDFLMVFPARKLQGGFTWQLRAPKVRGERRGRHKQHPFTALFSEATQWHFYHVLSVEAVLRTYAAITDLSDGGQKQIKGHIRSNELNYSNILSSKKTYLFHHLLREGGVGVEPNVPLG